MTEAALDTDLQIIPYASDHQSAFKSLNEEWIMKYFTLEERDRRTLDSPHETILSNGGYIFMATHKASVVGTCALIRQDDLTFELAKMAVAPSYRGRGIGFALGKHCIDMAKATAIKKIVLLSNTALAPAIGLYKKLGFAETPLPATDYQRANIHMEIDLQPKVKASVLVAGDLPAGLAMNAASLVTATLGHRLKHLIGNEVTDSSGCRHAGLTWLPIAILKCDRISIGEIRERALKQNVMTIDVPSHAQATTTYHHYEALMRQSSETDLSYLAMGLYGDRDIVTNLTGKLSLYK